MPRQPSLPGLIEIDPLLLANAARWPADDDVVFEPDRAITADAAVVSLNIVTVRGEQPVPMQALSLVAGEGIVGERRFGAGNRRDKHVTLVEAEAVAGAVAVCGRAFSARDTRRNVVTHGVALNHLVGRRFMLGDAILVGVERCDPCSRLARFTSRAFEKALVNRGGLRAEIIGGGDVVVGAAVRLV